MEKSREALLIVSDACYPEALADVFDRGGGHSERTGAGMQSRRWWRWRSSNPEGARSGAVAATDRTGRP